VDEAKEEEEKRLQTLSSFSLSRVGGGSQSEQLNEES